VRHASLDRIAVGLAMCLLCVASRAGRAADSAEQAHAAFASQVGPLVARYCHECHAGDAVEGDVDLASFGTAADMRKQIKVWQRVAEVISDGQMPPPDARQPTEAERESLRQGLRAFLAAEAVAHAGDPGRVVLRRLNNAEYTWTIRDLTGVASLDPAREFPVDAGAGEGFTNTGQSLVMSPALVTKYLDAAKAVAGHAVLLPDGFRFSAADSRAGWTEEAVERIRGFYAKYDRNDPTAYLAATLALRHQAAAGSTAPSPTQDLKPTLVKQAGDRGLAAKYLERFWTTLSARPDADEPSPLLDDLRRRWEKAAPADATALAAAVMPWRSALWRINKTGWIGLRVAGEGHHDREGPIPVSFADPVTPLVDRQEFRVKLAVPEGSDSVTLRDSITLRLAAADAGDGHDQDFVVWENPRLVTPGRVDLPLRLVRHTVATLAAQRERLAATAAACLAAVSEALAGPEVTADGVEAVVAALAEKHAVDPRLLAGWFSYLGIGLPEAAFTKLLDKKLEKIEGWEAVSGWAGEGLLQVIANSSDEQYRIPGTVHPHGVVVHPDAKHRVIVGWRSPVTGTVEIRGATASVHQGCSNGIARSVEVWRGKTREKLVTAANHGTPFGPFGPLDVRRGDVVAVVIGARDGNASCDLTRVDFTIRSGDREWDLARDVSGDILAANPHADGQGNEKVWHFAAEPEGSAAGWTIPAGSLLARWMTANEPGERGKLAADLEHLLGIDGADLPKESPDAELRRTFLSATGPLLARLELAADAEVASDEPGANETGDDGAAGIDPRLFGRHPHGLPVDAKDLCIQAPKTISVTIPAELAAGAEFVTAASIHPQAGGAASVQLQAGTAGDDATPGLGGLSPALPLVAAKDSAAWRKFEKAFADIRRLFPAALCYPKVRSNDKPVTFNVFYRDDALLKELVLDGPQAAEIDRLWDELMFISRDPIEMLDVHEQLTEFATQDRPQLLKALDEVKPQVVARAAAFEQRLVDAEPLHMPRLLDFAARAWRRPLRPKESRELDELYSELRRDDLPHEQAFALALARVLVAPAFLYKVERPAPGGPQPLSDGELATRLSYFLWSSPPDAELSRTAAAGRLHEPEVLLAQTRRMLRDDKTRRLAEEFGTQWLHVHGFSEHDEKSAETFPTFAALRGAMEEETILFLADFFQNDRSILSLLDADHTFLNEDLAKHYGIDGVTGPQWRRVDGVRRQGRGGILGLATTLATQSGASRTSPILRGNWLAAVVLGEKLPKPPKNVPQFPDKVPEGLTERQMTALHSGDAACAKCHMRIDPFGFSLEQFDAIGRFRTHDAAGLPIDASTKLMDGTAIDGQEGLRSYLLTNRGAAFERQFCRKLLGYALGRAVQLSDEPLLDEIQAKLAGDGHRVHAAIEAIVSSRQFRDIRGADSADGDE
jgi:hypothetical protein